MGETALRVNRRNRRLRFSLCFPKDAIEAAWEANDYSGVNLDGLQSIADVLGVQMRETITYVNAA